MSLADPPNRLRVLIAAGIPKRREGGAAAIAYNLGNQLENLGHRVSYVFFDDLMANEPRSRFGDTIFSWRLANYIRENRSLFDVVNLHAPCGMAYGLLRKWHRNAGYPPYVMTLHGLEERRVHVMTREHKKGRAWNFGWKNRAWHRLYHFPRFRWSIRTADAAHVYSRDVWNWLVLNYDLDDRCVRYIPLGVEERFFRPRDYGISGVPRLLYAGTWLDQRGIFYLRDALRSLAPRHQFTMTFAGPIIAADEIFSFFGDDLRPRIQVRDAIRADLMQELYAEHDIFVFPSLIEGLPNVLQEAMAGGMPVVTSETCGMPDVVENEFNGLLIPPANAAALEHAIARLITSAELRATLGRTAQTTMRRYTWERAAILLQDLLIDAVRRCHHSKP